MLLGREPELEQIDGLLSEITMGSGAIAMLEGAAGIGKTALIGELTRRAAGLDFQVLSSVGAPLEHEYAFGVVRQLFAATLAPDLPSDDLLTGAAGLAATPLGLGPTAGRARNAWADPGAAAMHGLYWLTAKLGEQRPLVLLVDDAHWADLMSLRYLLYLARRLEGLTVLVLVAARPTGEDAAVELLAQLQVLPQLVRLRPSPLTARQVSGLLREDGVADPDERFVGALHQVTGGNPFLIGELARRLRAEGATGSASDVARVTSIAPEGVIRWVNARLLGLGPDARELASAYAVLGGEASLADAAALAGIDPSTAPVAADALITASILAAGQPHDFVHPLVRAAIHDALSPATRAYAHARAARLTDDRDGPSAVVAAHLLAAEPAADEWAVRALRRAAGEATATGAPGSAAAYLDRALRESPARETRVDLLIELGQAQFHAGMPGASEQLRHALELETDIRRRAEIGLTLGRSQYAAGDFAGARATFIHALSELEDPDDDLFLELTAWAVTDARSAADLPEIAEPRVQALMSHDLPGATSTERLLLAHLALRFGRSGELPAATVAGLARRALANGALLEDSGSDVGPYGAACLSLVHAGYLRIAIDELDQAVRASQRLGSRVAFAWFSLLRGIAHYVSGDVIDAAGDLENSRTAYSEAYEYVSPDVRGVLALCLIERGDLSAAEEALALPDREEQALAGQPLSFSYVYGLGRLHAANGRLEEALETLLRCEQGARESNAPNPAATFSWRSDAALIAFRLGRPQQAREIMSDTVKRAREFGSGHALGVALRVSGLLEAGDAGLQNLAEAVAVLEGAGAKLQLARALAEQGSALRRAGRRRDALEPLRRSLDLANSCGALALAARAREELVAAGARPRRERIWGADSLTASEMRVAQMAANGMTNPQIAQDLFVTRRTVETHLTSVYRKLDVTRREHLAKTLAVHA